MMLDVSAACVAECLATQREQSGSVLRSAICSSSNDTGVSVDDNCANQRWYVVHAQPHAESRAAFHLGAQGFGVFFPRYRKTVRHARKARSVIAPLFPNYLFLRLDLARDRWRAVNGTRGVVRLIMQGEMPQPVPHGIVESLLARTRADGAIDWTSSLKIGQAVCIADGPFANFVGTLEHLGAGRRVRVLLDLLGRSVSVALYCDALMPAA